ncbi:beta-glucosidase family protein [Haloarcula brevis]|uniref:beta-glucosidase family protein n=1 Tax=Haloarcula brevis TaxID=3111453 RepID=UPI00300EA7EE
MNRDIDTLIEELTLSEKLGLIHGTVDPDQTSTGYTPGVERLDIPPLRLVDGPLGVRAFGESATAFPASISLAASWDPALAREFGAELGQETAAHGQHVVLAPGVNIIRVPTGGRNFEYYSEDPYLTARIGVTTIKGIQSAGVGATIKHFVANNQEETRYEVSAEVEERALREIYLPAFRAAVEEADVASVMTAYNRVNGTFMGEHARLLSDVLKDEWGFEGFVMSDWWGTRSTVAAANAGLDMEMPGITREQYLPESELDDTGPVNDLEMPHLPDVPALFGGPLQDAVENGEVAESTIDEKVERILTTMERFDWPGDPDGKSDTDAHRELARRIAVSGTVLLKNDDALPVADDDSLAVLGPNADGAKLGGGGSSEVTASVESSPVEGLRQRGTAVTFERGVEPIAEAVVFGDTQESSEPSDADLDDAVAAAESADTAVVVVQDDATEFLDREDMTLPGRQDELVSAVAEVAERTVVVLRTSGPVDLPWLGSVDAVVQTWYPGQADGEALAAVLFGDAETGGRLPVTFGEPAAYPATDESAYPGRDDVARYDEGIFVGYRHFGKERLEPTFPFGHGLSYASIEYGQPTLTGTDGGGTVEVSVRNTSDRPGTAVVQVYVEKAAAPVETPPRELAGFARLSLAPGEATTASVSLTEEAFAYYDETSGWTVPDGTNRIHVGRSVRDIVATFEHDT